MSTTWALSARPDFWVPGRDFDLRSRPGLVLRGLRQRDLSCRAILGRDLDLRSRQGWKPWEAALGRDLNFASRPGWVATKKKG